MNIIRIGLALLFSTVVATAATVGNTTQAAPAADIKLADDRVEIIAGDLVRTIETKGNRIITSSLRVSGEEVASRPAPDFRVTFYQAEPNQRPVGLQRDAVSPVSFQQVYQNWLKQIRSVGSERAKLDVPAPGPQAVVWKNPLTIDGESMRDLFQLEAPTVTVPRSGVKRLILRARVLNPAHPLHHVAIDEFYEVYDGYPVIRKWIEVTNNGPNWLKIDRLTIDASAMSADFGSTVSLTPREYGACSSVVAFGNALRSRGLIAASEISSALRSIADDGSMGYADDYLEWVLGPSERFESEPVFHFAYSGEIQKTASGVSTPLDRAVEGPYIQFLERVVGVRATKDDPPAPVWCSWANFKANVTDATMREQADIAARAGFRTFLIDDGWSTPSLGNTEPVVAKFPDFEATSRYIRSKGLRLGLWISCIRHADSQDLAALPEAPSVPQVERSGGIGMSFTSPWPRYFANDLVYMHDRFGATYVKEDFSQIIFGDIAEGHEGRTWKESLLRGLRALMQLNDDLAQRAPGLYSQITHEIYWGTPGPPCDIAALKHCSSYHIPPNTHLGNPSPNQRIAREGTFDPVKLRKGLIQGCWVARQRYFAHRGLPLYPLEYYCAGTANFKDSLTTAVQDRQVCSWLMSTLSVFAGDLASLTAENVEHYRKRFELVRRLQDTYDIYHHFQYSGVPEPTDTDWHWWGKLNETGHGAVVVIRGSAGDDSRVINIPWVRTDRSYEVSRLLEARKLGKFTGEQLRAGTLTLALPAYGQELLELAPAGE